MIIESSKDRINRRVGNERVKEKGGLSCTTEGRSRIVQIGGLAMTKGVMYD